MPERAYLFSEAVKKLKDEYKSLPGAEIGINMLRVRSLFSIMRTCLRVYVCVFVMCARAFGHGILNREGKFCNCFSNLSAYRENGEKRRRGVVRYRADTALCLFGRHTDQNL